MLGGQPYYIAKFWCFGTTAAPNPRPSGVYPLGPSGDNDSNQVAGEPEDGGFTCDGTTLNNASQTDIFKADILFSATQARNNSDFTCSPKACEQRWADGVVTNVQGKRKDGTNVLATRSDPAMGLVAQTVGNPYDPVTEGTFYSLGFLTGAATGNYVAVQFNNPVFDFPGADLKIYEVTGGSSYPDETVQVEISQDNISWVTLAANAIRDEEMDISGILPWFKYVKITGTSPIATFESCR
jgi:hypothetical protein